MRNQNGRKTFYIYIYISFFYIYTNGCVEEKKASEERKRNLNTRNDTLASLICLKERCGQKFNKKLK